MLITGHCAQHSHQDRLLIVRSKIFRPQIAPFQLAAERSGGCGPSLRRRSQELLQDAAGTPRARSRDRSHAQATSCQQPPGKARSCLSSSKPRALLYLLHLKLDGGFDLVHLGHQVLIVSEERREFAGFVQARTQDSRDLLDQGLGGQEGIVLLGCEERKGR